MMVEMKMFAVLLKTTRVIPGHQNISWDSMALLVENFAKINDEYVESLHLSFFVMVLRTSSEYVFLAISNFRNVVNSDKLFQCNKI